MKKESKTDWNRIQAQKDEDIDLSESPELSADFFEGAVPWPAAVAEKLDITLNELYSLLHVTPRTAQGLINTEKLDPDMSDGIVQLMKVHDRCMEVFESREKMIRWLKTPNYALGDNTPLSLLGTSDGIELVRNSLTKIEYGVLC